MRSAWLLFGAGAVIILVLLSHLQLSAPASPQDYVALARQCALEAGISPALFEKQIRQESNFNPHALSRAGAAGIAQFMPATAKELGIDPWNPEQALRGAAYLMASYLGQYSGDYAKALAAYNAGPGALASAVRRGGSAWRAFLPGETRHYIAVILEEG